MTFRLFDAPQAEPSQFVGFAGNIIDRQSENRADDSVEKALADPLSPPAADGRRPHPAETRRRRHATEGYFTSAEAVALGVRDRQRRPARLFASGPGRRGPGRRRPRNAAARRSRRSTIARSICRGCSTRPRSASWRKAAACSPGTPATASAANAAQPTADARRRLQAPLPRLRHRAFSAHRSGRHHARPSPRDKCVLGRGRHFAPGMYSALAGFIEPGETIENAVRRETFEEAGIRLGRVVYHASQPWPFPYSLMIGCFGEALNEDIHADLNELEDCRWFERDEVLAMLGKTHPEPLRAAVRRHRPSPHPRLGRKRLRPCHARIFLRGKFQSVSCDARNSLRGKIA